MFGLVLAAVFALGAVTAASAMAEPHKWLVNGENVELGVELATQSELVKPMRLEDTDVLGMKVEVECKKATDTGDVLAMGVDKELTLAFELASCTVVAGTLCSKLVAVTAVNLPWETQLSGTTFRDSFVKGTGGDPGWLVQCETPLGKFEDKCTSSEFSLLAENNVEGKDVELKADANTEGIGAECTVGGAGTGLILEGASMLVRREAATLAVSI